MQIKVFGMVSFHIQFKLVNAMIVFDRQTDGKEDT